jgi:hypothetical protein
MTRDVTDAYKDMHPTSLLGPLYPYGFSTGGEFLTLFHGEEYVTMPYSYFTYNMYEQEPLIWIPNSRFAFGINVDAAKAEVWKKVFAKSAAAKAAGKPWSQDQENAEFQKEWATSSKELAKIPSHGVTDPVGAFVSNVVKVAGRAVGTVLDVAQDAIGVVTGLVSKIPIVGGLVTSVFEAAYHAATSVLNFAIDVVVKGKRIDEAFMKQLKTALQDFKQIAPYAQMVISVIPGIGSGVSAALSAGLALAEGQSIEEAIKAGLIGALPGGPLIKAAVTMGVETLQHVAKGEKVDFATLAQTAGGIAGSALGIPIVAKNALMAGISTVGGIIKGQPLDKTITDGAIGALPIDNKIKSVMTDATAVTLDLANGKKFDTALLSRVNNIANQLPAGNPLKETIASGIQTAKDAGKNTEQVMFATMQSGLADTLVSMGATNLPSDAQKAIKSGIALGSGVINQSLREDQLTKVTGKFAESGIQQVKTTPMFEEARKVAAAKGGTKGFDIATGLLYQQAKVFDISKVRNALTNPADKMGFDVACATRIGAVANGKPPNISPAAYAGHVITKGMQGYVPDRKQAIMEVVSTIPSTAVGATLAIKQIAAKREKLGPQKIQELVQKRAAKLSSIPSSKRSSIPSMSQPTVIKTVSTTVMSTLK